MSDKTETSNQTDLQKEAEQLKNQANDHFKSILAHHFMWSEPNLKFFNTQKNLHFPEKEYDKAIDFYTKAIDLVPKNAVYFANRSLAHLRLENFGFALQDAVNIQFSCVCFFFTFDNIVSAQLGRRRRQQFVFVKRFFFSLRETFLVSIINRNEFLIRKVVVPSRQCYFYVFCDATFTGV